MGAFEFFSKLGNVIYLSVLWFICCIPVVTIGASTTAYCYIMNKLIWNNEGYITKGFFKAFKENFKKSTKVWMVFLVAIVVLVTDYYIIVYLSGEYGGMYYAMIPAYMMLIFLLLAMLIYAFPYMAKFEDTSKNVIKNSFLMSTRHLGYTLFMMVADALILFAGFRIFLLILLIAPAAIGFINVGLLNFVFRRYEK